uniref:Uncharacterized protein n=1 Tax=Cyprinus carpio TaxID=7962 RepID=A0A8C2I6U0_CYPCA
WGRCVLRVFRDLHKTRRHVFKDDDRALTAYFPSCENVLLCSIHVF